MRRALFVVLLLMLTRPALAQHLGSRVQWQPQITVGGYDPDRIVVRKGTPVRLNFFRNETSWCSERVLFEAFGINLELPAFQTTSVTLAPDKPGEYPFTCGMNMLRGTLVVEE